MTAAEFVRDGSAVVPTGGAETSRGTRPVSPAGPSPYTAGRLLSHSTGHRHQGPVDVRGLLFMYGACAVLAGVAFGVEAGLRVAVCAAGFGLVLVAATALAGSWGEA